MKQLSGLDAAFLCMETASTPMHTMGVVLLSAGSPRVTVRTLRTLLLERMHLLPVLEQRLVEMPLGLDRPILVDDPDFDIDDHVTDVGWKAPRTRVDLDRAISMLASRPLDRRRPLWDAWFFDGLEHDRSAFVFKVHHAIMDGVSAAQFLGRLLDTEPSLPLHCAPPSPARAYEAWPRRGTLMRRVARSQIELPMRAARTALGAVRGARDLWSDQRTKSRDPERESRTDATASRWPLPVAPRTGFDGRLTAEREVARGSAPLEDFRFIKKAFDASVNDVLLAVCTLALRNHLVARKRLPRKPLVASVPISTRTDADEAAGNRVSNMLVRLPVHVERPDEVMRFMRRETRDAKRAHELFGARLLGPSLESTAVPALRWLARQHERFSLADFHPPLCNIIVSNVPGPPMTLYCAGIAVEAVHGFGPLMDGTPFNLTALSYAGRMDFGLLACPTRDPDGAELMTGSERAVEELRDVAERVGRR